MAIERRYEDGLTLSSVTGQVARFAVQKAFDRSLMSDMPRVAVDTMLMDEVNALVVKLSAQMVGTNGREIKWTVVYPKTWWDHWKSNFMSKKQTWWRKLILSKLAAPEMTVERHSEMRYDNVCPHIRADQDRFHYEFLQDGSKPSPGNMSIGTVIRELRFIQRDLASSRVSGAELIARSYDSTIEYLEGKYRSC